MTWLETIEEAKNEIIALREINADLLEALKKISIKGIVGRDIYAVLEEMREIAREAIRNHEM